MPLFGGLREKIAIFGVGVCALLNIYSTQPLLVDIARQLDVSETRSTWTISATTLGISIVAPVAGAVSDHLGRRQVMIPAAALLAGASFCCGLAWDFNSLLLFRFSQGLLVPFVFAVAVAYISEEWEGRAAKLMNSLCIAGTAFGGFAGRFISGAIASVGGWRSTFFALAVIPILVAVAIATWLPRERHFKRSPTIRGGLKNLGLQLRDWRLQGTCFIGASLLFQQVVSFTYCGLRLMRAPFYLSPLEISWVYAVFLIAVVVTPLSGRLAATFGRRDVYILGALLGIFGLLLTLSTEVWIVVLGLALSCTSVFVGQVCATGYAAERETNSRSGAAGFYLTSYYLGGSLGGAAPAPLYTAYGWGACLALVLCVTVASMVVAASAWREPQT